MRLDALYVDGDITTGDPDRPRARRLGVWRGRVAGLDDDLDGCTADTVVDLRGAPVVPGFHDAHHHLSMRGQRLRQVDLTSPGVAGLDELYARVAERAASLEAGAWVLGHGYDQNKIGGHPTREALDRAAGGRPVWLTHNSGHMGVLSTEGFRRAGLADLDAVPDVPGGRVARDDRGRPDGLLAERAQELAQAVLRPEPFEDWVRGIGMASDVALSEGTTSITEPGICAGLAGNGPADLAAFLTARERGVLRVRATLMPAIDTLHETGDVEPGHPWFGLDLGVRTGLGDEWVRVGAVKVFSDGSLIGRTAAMREPYADPPGAAGFLVEEAATLHERIVAAHAHGWQVATHAIGDAALDVVLDAYEDAQRRFPRPGVRHRVEHAGVTGDDQVARMAALGVVPVPQGHFVGEIGDGMLQALGPERSRLCYRQRSFLDAGIVVPGSSDCPVVRGAPLLGIHDLVNRRTGSGQPFTPEEALTVEEALHAYTYGSAYADHQEHEKGRLARGLLADLVVLGEDLSAVDPARIADVPVVATVVGGVPEFGAGDLRVS
ncbi:putative amidohydrolase YtcJ [Geodermatophilus bullaregiensis]|uniref:amidohydrolase n=1 Tax=Geodermatophilus bullaregiensis TaxID=1564160 RepID=UPI0019592243|nr:amidohydrolase [Geodermatophilus bullaregiensis]MBM7809033.1 putative amidohydrolase YtcJ [Geodermatophilus bullaregiensis]